MNFLHAKIYKITHDFPNCIKKYTLIDFISIIYICYFINKSNTLGKKISKPTIKATMALTKTAPAAISLARPAIILYSGLTISTTISNAVLTISKEITNPNKIKQVIHSHIAILKNIPDIITNNIIVV